MTALGRLAITPQQARLAADRGLRRHTPVPPGAGVHQALRQHATTDPDRPAIVDGRGVLTYAEARRLVDGAAAALAAQGCGAGDVVAVSGPRSGGTILLFLALEVLGAVYLPIDPAWPRDRCVTVLRRSGARRVVAHSGAPAEAVAKAAADAGVPVQVVDTGDLPAPAGSSRPPHVPAGAEPRYIIYTSGTTGVPKGAVVEQRGMMNHLHAKADDLDLGPGDVIAFTAPLAFDISIWQMLIAPLTGGTVVVLDEGQATFPQRLLRALREHRVTVAELVPTVIGFLLDQLSRAGAATAPLPALRWLISTGEELHPALAARALRTLPAARLLNAYGPTECSDDVTHHVVTLADTEGRRLPVGGPVANTALYVLVQDGDGWRAAGDDEAGELFVGGLGVGAGYVDEPAATTAAFFADELDPASPTGRLYRTGDLAAIREGVVHYLGRRDRQVKVSGVRIELDEVEAVIERHPGVARCAAVTAEADGRTELLAYVVTAGPAVDADELTAFLQEHVPPALIPRRWRWLASLPLTPNGKTDYQAIARWSHDRKENLDHAG